MRSRLVPSAAIAEFGHAEYQWHRISTSDWRFRHTPQVQILNVIYDRVDNLMLGPVVM